MSALSMSGDATQRGARGSIRLVAAPLLGSDRPLAVEHDVALLDLDGVVYVGRDAVPGAPAALARARELGMRLAFVTNNAARPPSVVAEHLTELGIQADSSEVITSSQAAARYLADHLADGARVLVVGTTGLDVALTERGLTPIADATAPVAAVVQGYSPTLDWALLAEGAVAINSGALWVATNVDPTVPSPRGPLPGNGSLVAALRMATGREPVVTGKPDPTMHRETMLRTHARAPIVIGDRLDTDIEGANAVGCPSLLVFTGVTTPTELLSAAVQHRPSFLGADVSALLDAHVAPTADGPGWTCGRWRAERGGDGVVALALAGGGEAGRVSSPHGSAVADLPTEGVADAQDLDALRALCAASWSRGDGPASVVVRVAGRGKGGAAGGRSDEVASVLSRLGLPA